MLLGIGLGLRTHLKIISGDPSTGPILLWSDGSPIGMSGDQSDHYVGLKSMPSRTINQLPVGDVSSDMTLLVLTAANNTRQTTIADLLVSLGT